MTPIFWTCIEVENSVPWENFMCDGTLRFKLQQDAISGNLLSGLSDFLINREQRVILNGQSISLANLEVGVSHSLILCPSLLFITLTLCINELIEILTCNRKLIGESATFSSAVQNIITSSADLDDLDIVTRNGRIVWKHGPNGPFYALMLRTKLY